MTSFQQLLEMGNGIGYQLAIIGFCGLFAIILGYYLAAREKNSITKSNNKEGIKHG